MVERGPHKADVESSILSTSTNYNAALAILVMRSVEARVRLVQNQQAAPNFNQVIK